MFDWFHAFHDSLPQWLQEFSPVVILLVIVGLIFYRLPTVEVGHDKGFKRRRLMNWLPLGLTYAFLYMGRYNLKISKFAFEEMKALDDSPLMGNADFGVIFMWGTIVYGVSFLINGPLTDRLGGRFSILMGAGGAMVLNALMGLASWSLLHHGPMFDSLSAHFVVIFSLLYSVNMYFQSFGAVAIVKVNAPWFHVRERGVFGAIFGILISLGIYFAFDLGDMILTGMGLVWVFFMPAILLGIFWLLDFFIVRNRPSLAGQEDFNTGDATSGQEGPRMPALKVFMMMARNPIIMTIAAIEFCSGFLRQSIMQWFRTFAKQTDVALGLKSSFVYDNWGLLLCIAGITGGVIAGSISDHAFQSRRGPVAGLLYGVMLAGAVLLVFTYQMPWVGWLVVLMSMAVIGVHGMLSGTASMDFGGARNAGIAVGIIDGFVYLGTAVMSGTYALILPDEELDAAGRITGAAADPANWRAWPLAMIPMAIIGLVLAFRLWNAKPKPKTGSA
ncbi:MFS transporter [bacterium]|nr:MFS transporter [bacterium]PIV80678.1 MAG: MFS transporter [bacterium CG17_big_fil_post_rev_8_21_14_2_50_64_8]PJA76098.1 MAG: MFS transporter [bacterium CG_4_9_14_3_um_filter_65_15]